MIYTSQHNTLNPVLNSSNYAYGSIDLYIEDTQEYNLSRIGLTLVISLLLGSIFWRIGQLRKNSADLHSVIGAMHLAVLYVCFCNHTTVQPVIASERTVFYRENSAGMYTVLPHALSQVMVEMPYVLFQATYFSLIIYSMMSFQWTAMKFLFFFIISFLSFLYFTYFGMLAMALSPNMQAAAILSSSFFILFTLLSGFIIPKPIRDYVLKHFGYKEDFNGIMIAVLLGFVILFALSYAYCVRSLNFQKR
ncbi:hypothetical protein HPP92_024461 [Vanilla planifolia]|uniref:ABC-2 type transporter transmembrane domain-containing protein n=1 Tax=Vanilla planifolia TaxID=51239 RepID=A0A835U9Y1_VANPL|nr:hypothetical protein HPP92_024461 [Vanilla planifolia]